VQVKSLSETIKALEGFYNEINTIQNERLKDESEESYRLVDYEYAAGNLRIAEKKLGLVLVDERKALIELINAKIGIYVNLANLKSSNALIKELLKQLEDMKQELNKQ